MRPLDRIAIAILLGTISLPCNAQTAQEDGRNRVWAEYGVSSIQVGYDMAHHSDVYRKVLIGSIGPADVGDRAHETVRTCSKLAADAFGMGLSEDLDFKVDAFSNIEADLEAVGAALDTTNIKAAYTKRIDGVSAIFSDRVMRFHDAFRKCLRKYIGTNYKTIDEQFHVGIVWRICEPFAVRDCTAPPFVKSAYNRSFFRFQKVFEWLKVNGYPAVNVWHQLSPAGGAAPELGSLGELYNDKLWPELPSSELVFNQFQIGAKNHRASGTKFDYAVAEIVGIPRPMALHLLDVLSSPGRAVSTLPTEWPKQVLVNYKPGNFFGVPLVISTFTERAPTALSLSLVSDEVARTRITECSAFRGLEDDQSISNCAGYKLSHEQLVSCLTDKLCVPEFNDKGLGAALVLSSIINRKDLATSAPLPRLRLNAPVPAFENTARQCGEQNSHDDAAATLCLIANLAGQNEKILLSCLEPARKHQTTPASCLANSLPQQYRELATCIANGSRAKGSDAVLCVATHSLDTQSRQRLNCIREHPKDTTQLALCLGGEQADPDLKLATECLSKHKNDRSSAALCFADKKNQISPEAKQAFDCAQTKGSNPKEFATCMAAKQLPKVGGDLGKLANCAIMNQGSYLATAGCMMSDQLTPEQQIMLQCTSESVDLLSYSACVGGQLSVREFGKCRETSFGKDDCFGPNNEIRKFVKNVFGRDIDNNTVAGQVYNAELDVLKFQVTFAETEAKTLEQLANGAVLLANRAVEGISHVATEIAAAVEKGREAACGITLCIAGVPTAVPKIPTNVSIGGVCIGWGC